MSKKNMSLIHTSEDPDLTLDRIDFGRRISQSYPTGLGVVIADSGTDYEWYKRGCHYEIKAECKVLDMRERQFTDNIMRYFREDDFSYTDTMERYARNKGYGVIILNRSGVGVLTNGECVKSFRRIR